MSDRYQAPHIQLEYVKSQIDTELLWERHCHAQFEMIGVIEGDISVVIEGKPYRLTENQATLIPPLCYHTVTANKQGRYRRVTALFDDAFIPPVLRDHMLPSPEIAIFYTTNLSQMKQICQKSDPDFYTPLAQSLMIQSFYEHIRAKQGARVTDGEDFLQKTVSYIDAHLGEKILLDDLARLTARSKSSFCHLFEEKMKISPKQYILQKKLALANKWIEEGIPPTVVSIRLGYENYSNFYRLYRRHFEKSPSKEGREEPSYEGDLRR